MGAFVSESCSLQSSAVLWVVRECFGIINEIDNRFYVNVNSQENSTLQPPGNTKWHSDPLNPNRWPSTMRATWQQLNKALMTTYLS